MNYRLEAVWPTPPAAVREEVIRFWLAESALPDRPAAAERAHQLLVVARDADGQVRASQHGRAHRAQGLRSTQLFWQMLRASYHVLNQRFGEGCDPEVLGAYAEVENASIMKLV
jgi:hypothetical protein